MRGARLIMIRQLIPAAFALAGAALAPALAGQSAAGIDMSGPMPGLPPPAESGKPAIGAPPAAPLGPSASDRCLPALPCDTRLLGTVRKNGAIELQVPAWR